MHGLGVPALLVALRENISTASALATTRLRERLTGIELFRLIYDKQEQRTPLLALPCLSGVQRTSLSIVEPPSSLPIMLQALTVSSF